MAQSKWWSIGGSLFLGLFVAYLDRTNLSVAIRSVAEDLGFAGDQFAVTSSWALTIFLIGYAFSNIARRNRHPPHRPEDCRDRMFRPVVDRHGRRRLHKFRRRPARLPPDPGRRGRHLLAPAVAFCPRLVRSARTDEGQQHHSVLWADSLRWLWAS